ncbi:MAG: Wzz/FepE/Etk N-terminal domain-containing protein [Kiloniellaceae bacterium]
MAEQVPEPADDRAERAVRVRDARIAPAAAEIGARVGDDVVDLRFLFAALWRGIWVILALALLGGLYGLWNLRNFVPQYVASMVVDPSQSGAIPLRASPNRLGGLAGVAKDFGLNLGQVQTVTPFDRLRLVISSITLAESLQNKYGYLQKVYAGSWDPVEKQWIRPSGKRYESTQRIRRLFHLRAWSAPTIESLSGYLGGMIRFERLEDLPFQRVSVTHTDPDFALELLRTVYAEADELLRWQDRKATAQRKAYIEKQLETAALVELRSVLVGLLANEERTAMLLAGDRPYAARIMEPPFVSNTPTEPNRVKIVGLPAILGLVGGALLVTLIAVFRRE